MTNRGRPRSSPLTRVEQLREAKRAQRARQAAAGTQMVQLALPLALAGKLAAARHAPDFLAALEAAVDRLVVRVADYPVLRDLMWNRSDEIIPAQEAFSLYERNWRFVEGVVLDSTEAQLLARLTDDYGNGIING